MKQEGIAGAVLYVIGLVLLLLSPSSLWAITEKWKTKEESHPSSNYIIVMRILGVVFAGTGVLLIAGILK